MCVTSGLLSILSQLDSSAVDISPGMKKLSRRKGGKKRMAMFDDMNS